MEEAKRATYGDHNKACRHKEGSPRSIVKAYQDVHMRACTHTHMNAHMHAPAHRHHACRQKQYHMKANQEKLQETGQGELQRTSSCRTLLLSLLRAIFLLAALPAFAFPPDSSSSHSSSL